MYLPQHFTDTIYVFVYMQCNKYILGPDAGHAATNIRKSHRWTVLRFLQYANRKSAANIPIKLPPGATTTFEVGVLPCLTPAEIAPKC